ncbi:MAG: PaaI family thioesterase [Chitinophagales bacterium]
MAEKTEKVFNSFSLQGIMKTFGAELDSAQNGKAVITCNLNERLTQQNGFFHAGVLTTLVDSACGYAAYTTMPDDADVLTVEFKVNFLKPVILQKVYAVGRVIHTGKTLVVTEGIITDEKQEIVYVKMLATMMTILKK